MVIYNNNNKIIIIIIINNNNNNNNNNGGKEGKEINGPHRLRKKTYSSLPIHHTNYILCCTLRFNSDSVT